MHLYDAELDKRQWKTLQRLDEPADYSSKISNWKIQKNSVTKTPEFVSQSFEFNEPSSLFSFDKSQLKITEPQNTITLPSNFSITRKCQLQTLF